MTSPMAGIAIHAGISVSHMDSDAGFAVLVVQAAVHGPLLQARVVRRSADQVVQMHRVPPEKAVFVAFLVEAREGMRTTGASGVDFPGGRQSPRKVCVQRLVPGGDRIPLRARLDAPGVALSGLERHVAFFAGASALLHVEFSVDAVGFQCRERRAVVDDGDELRKRNGLDVTRRQVPQVARVASSAVQVRESPLVVHVRHHC
mmetsp:Transcript_11017/g.27045  ORF Transcript_11017/g.27045 Transcript_11017/m.27045 type:complete len:203 (+) Transcript_11017:640-1248(+)